MKNMHLKMKTTSVSMALALVLGAMQTAPAQATTMTYSGAGFDIPDGSFRGGSSNIAVTDTGALTGVSISISLSHTFVGDLSAKLIYRPGSGNFGLKSVDIFRVLGYTDPPGYGYGSDLAGVYTFSDSAILDFAEAASLNEVIPEGAYRSSTNIFTGSAATTNPFTSLNSTFAGLERAGNWTLKIDDFERADIGSVSAWSLSLTTADTLPVPEPNTWAMFAFGAGLLGWRLRRLSAKANRSIFPPTGVSP